MKKRNYSKIISDVMGQGNLTQKSLGALLGVTQGSVNHWLTGRAKPSKINLDAIKRLQRIFEAKDQALTVKPSRMSSKRLKMDSIALQAHKIVNERSEEKERQYGVFTETMARATRLLRVMSGIEHLPEEVMYYAMIALKLSRESNAHKRDNLMDAIAYMQALENMINERHATEL